ncbi:MAG: nitroreductase family deazaflavin-dependent oxidoreductase [Actinomycetota bacterium]
MNEFNQGVIEEFRANEGRVGGPFEGAPMILVHHTGAKTGTERVTPLVYRPDGDTWVIFASKAGAPSHPHWYHNLIANPQTTIEVGTETIEVDTVEVTGEERSRIWEAQKRDAPQFAEYDAKTDREIPVLVFSRR